MFDLAIERIDDESCVVHGVVHGGAPCFVRREAVMRVSVYGFGKAKLPIVASTPRKCGLPYDRALEALEKTIACSAIEALESPDDATVQRTNVVLGDCAHAWFALLEGRVRKRRCDDTDVLVLSENALRVTLY